MDERMIDEMDYTCPKCHSHFSKSRITGDEWCPNPECTYWINPFEEEGDPD